MMDLADLVDVTVHARPLGYDGRSTDDTDWSLYPTDMPADRVVVGALTINRVDDLDYIQYVVDGIPVDPTTVRPVDHALVASGFEFSSTAAALKAWDKRGRKEETLAAPYDEPLDLDAAGTVKAGWTPGKKAAMTKALNKLKAEKAAAALAAAEAEAKHLADASIMSYTEERVPVPSEAFDNASDDLVMSYLASSLSPSALDKIGSTPADRVAAAKLVAQQHLADTEVLVGLGYMGAGPMTGSPMESRRAVLRETGERRPTGGPNPGGGHVFYGENEISGMKRSKVDAIIRHHSAGEVDPSAWSDPEARLRAIMYDAQYQTNVTALTATGALVSAIPHSQRGTSWMLEGDSGGLPEGMSKTQAYTPPPKPSPLASAPGPLGKPANWNDMGPGQKSAWTKKQNKLLKESGQQSDAPKTGGTKHSTPQPAEWESWGPGKKAAWTKKQNALAAGTISAVAGLNLATTAGKPLLPPGTHTSHYGGRSDRSSALKYRSKENDAQYKARRAAFSDKLRQADYEAHSAWESYVGNGYGSMNQCMKYGVDCTPGVQKRIADLNRALKFAEPGPAVVIRGKSRGSLADLDYKVGDVYTENKFVSTSTDKGTAASSMFGGGSQRSVLTVIRGTDTIPVIPGNYGERETIIPPGHSYRVLAIQDYETSGRKHRLIEVEIVK